MANGDHKAGDGRWAKSLCVVRVYGIPLLVFVQPLSLFCTESLESSWMIPFRNRGCLLRVLSAASRTTVSPYHPYRRAGTTGNERGTQSPRARGPEPWPNSSCRDNRAVTFTLPAAALLHTSLAREPMWKLLAVSRLVLQAPTFRRL